MAMGSQCAPIDELTAQNAINGMTDDASSGATIPEFGEAVTIQIISESSIDADVTVRYLIIEVEVRRTRLRVRSF